MAKYRKRPVVIDAVQMTDEQTMALSIEGWPDWLKQAAALRPNRPGALYWREGEDGKACLWVATLEGPLRVSPNDWIIRGVHGELYPCKPEVFAATYEGPLQGGADADE